VVETMSGEQIGELVRRADDLEAGGEVRAAIELLTNANRVKRHSQLERALVRVRRGGCRWLPPPTAPTGRTPVTADPPDGDIFEIGPEELTVVSLRAGLARSGCVLVRGLVQPERVARLVNGIDLALAAHDAAELGDETVDRGWYDPISMPDRVTQSASVGITTPADAFEPARMPERLRRRFVRESGGLWTTYSPRMLFELFELVEDVGIGALMTAYLGERPLLSANKCTLRRVPPETVNGGWHQDGAFLGDHVGSFNFWLSLSSCGRDAPGLDIVPRRIDEVLTPGEGAQFDWSLSDEAVAAAAGDLPIVRPEFEAGDALLFDHRLVHRTGASDSMTRERHAIESWFFAPSAYPAGQLPIVF
jgi:Phytanoyl-CoA dioxygenase (PhyH)